MESICITEKCINYPCKKYKETSDFVVVCSDLQSSKTKKKRKAINQSKRRNRK